MTTTADNGTFRVLSLPLGPVDITGEKPNFKKTVRTGITLVVGQETVVHLRLEVGDLKQEVTVSSAGRL